MPRPPRADEAGGLYHALNRANMRAEIFKKEGDYEAFERILHEGLEIHQVELFSFQLMPNHYRLVLRPLADGEMSCSMSWVVGTYAMWYYGHFHNRGMGYLYQQRYKSFPIQDDDHLLILDGKRNETCFAPDLFAAPRIGNGDHFGGGFKGPTRRYYPHCR